MQKKSSLLEKIAAITSAAILISGIIYWSLQVYYANQMLNLAYGGG